MKLKTVCNKIKRSPAYQALLNIVTFGLFLHFYLIFFHKPINAFSMVSSLSSIESKILQINDKCGTGYPIFWFVLDDIDKDKFMVKNIFEKDVDCKNDIKCFEKYFNKDFPLDRPTKEFLYSLKDGQVIFPDIQRLIGYQSMNNVLRKSDRYINFLGLVVVKNIRRNIVYTFSVSDTIGNNLCSKDYLKFQLEELALIAKGQIL